MNRLKQSSTDAKYNLLVRRKKHCKKTHDIKRDDKEPITAIDFDKS